MKIDTHNLLSRAGSLLMQARGILSPTISGVKASGRIIRQNYLGGSRYAASRPTRLGDPWSPTTMDINTLINQNSRMVKARVQQLVRDFPYFARATNVVVNYTVGSGMQFQAKVRDEDRKLVKPMNRKIEDAFKYWSDEMDLQGKQHFGDLQRLAKRQDIEAGEFLCVCVAAKAPNRFLPIGLRFYESDWLTSTGAKDEIGKSLPDASMMPFADIKGDRAVFNGIEFSPSTGEILAYHLADPNSSKAAFPVRIPARYVAHGHDVLRPNQLRGISPFVTSIMVAHDLSEIMNSELDAAHMASKWLAFVTSPDPTGMQGLRISTADTTADESKIEYLENATIEYLRKGEEITFANANRPGSNFEPFVKLILRMVAVTQGISYEVLSGDYQEISYSNLKGINNDMIKQFKPLQNRLQFQLLRKVHFWFMDWAYLTGRLILPGYETNPLPYMQAYWQNPGFESIDPLREGKADIDAIAAKIKSPQEVCAARGRDLEDVLEEISEALTLMKELGIEISTKPSTSLAGNPAAVSGQNADGNKGAGRKVLSIARKNQKSEGPDDGAD